MKTNELRIGNHVLCDGKPEKVTGIIQYGVYFDFGYCPNIGLIKPIELTEKWLIKFGFELYDDAGIYGVFREIFPPVSGFEITADSEGYWYWPAGIFNAIKIKSVHQLQNLYFALTGEELKLNENL